MEKQIKRLFFKREKLDYDNCPIIVNVKFQQIIPQFVIQMFRNKFNFVWNKWVPTYSKFIFISAICYNQRFMANEKWFVIVFIGNFWLNQRNEVVLSPLALKILDILKSDQTCALSKQRTNKPVHRPNRIYVKLTAWFNLQVKLRVYVQTF